MGNWGTLATHRPDVSAAPTLNASDAQTLVRRYHGWKIFYAYILMPRDCFFGASGGIRCGLIFGSAVSVA